ncbi:uncharacterized protein LOC117594071 [Esox lucius]|uniref:uncharacterized protein LOC117594071 n=1 Tax=Esox lucius TaxID=8010 RepID=UPI001476F017|nr:uncharacterized protein LOC117594071 [Esox lucius]
MMCLDPRKMYSSPDECLQKLKRLIEKFLLDKQLTGGISSGDVISLQFEKALSNEAKSLEFANFQPSVSRVDAFLSQNLSSYTGLWNFCKKLLLLSHGQAEVERGFSINKEVETCNMSEETVVVQRLICDQVNVCGGVTRVPLTKELISYCSSARSRYRAHLEEEKKKRETEENSKKRKYVEEDLKELKMWPGSMATTPRRVIERTFGMLKGMRVTTQRIEQMVSGNKLRDRLEVTSEQCKFP